MDRSKQLWTEAEQKIQTAIADESEVLPLFATLSETTKRVRLSVIETVEDGDKSDLAGLATNAVEQLEGAETAVRHLIEALKAHHSANFSQTQ